MRVNCRLLLVGLAIGSGFALTPRAAEAQGCGSWSGANLPAVDFDYTTGLWSDWISGDYFLDDPYAFCNDGAYRGRGWGYIDIWNSILFADWFDESSTFAGYDLAIMPNPTIQCDAGFRRVMFVRTYDNWIANQWCEPLPSPPGNWLQIQIVSWWEVAGMFFDFALGLGWDHQLYTQGSIQSYQMQSAPGLQGARNYWYDKNTNHIAYEYCTNLEAVYGFDVKFGLQGLVDAGGNATQQFIGSYKVSIIPHSDGTATFRIFNVTSMESLLYHIGSDWSWPRESVPLGIGGNLGEEITWEEVMCSPGV